MTPVLVAAVLGAAAAGFLALCAVTDPRWRAWARGGWARVSAWWRVSGQQERWRGAYEGVRRALRGFAGHGAASLKRSRDRRMQARERAQCLDELSELVDVVALGLSAGISFDAALAMYCGRYDTLLAGVLTDAMQSWRLGLATRNEALHAVAARLQVGAFSTFVETVTESLAFGAPLAQTLIEQAESIRQQRRYDVQERIEKAPIKMLVPTGTLILPAMLLAILGPLLASLTTSMV